MTTIRIKITLIMKIWNQTNTNKHTKIEQKQGNLTRGTKCEVRGNGISHYYI